MKQFYFFAITAVMLLSACGGGGKTREEKPTKPTKTDSVMQPKIKPIVKVYIENSYSIDGYVNGDTEFKEAVFNYLGKIKRLGISDTLNLFYINRIPIERGSVVQGSNAIVMQEFVLKLNPTTFRENGGTHKDRQESDLANIIKSVLSETKNNEVSILVSDGIFSPGNTDAANFLSIQREGIAITVDEYLDKYPKSAVIIYQLSSIFRSNPSKKIFFYNKENKPIDYTGQIPYYIYVFGDAKYLSELRNKIPDNDFIGGGVKHTFSIVLGNKQVNYAVRANPKAYTLSRKAPKTTIEDLKKDSHTKKVKFAVDVDFSRLLLDENYLQNVDNYENSSRYDLNIKKIDKQDKGYTHTLYFSSDKVYKGKVIVKLKTARPPWVDKVNDNDGSTAVADKTYGIKYQIDGIFDAFTQENKYYTEIKININ